MATLDMYASSGSDEARRALAAHKVMGQRSAYRESVSLSVRYMNSQQWGDVETELRQRYEEAQIGSRGDQIRPQMIPLMQRYIDEAASVYNRDVTRVLVDESGQETEATKKVTDQLRRMLDDASYDLTMHKVDQYAVACKTVGMWYQARAGKLRPQVITANNLYPLPPTDHTWHDPSDQNDYMATVVSLSTHADGTADRRWAWVESAQTGFYHGQTFDSVNGEFDWRTNPYQWPQTYDTDDLRGATAVLPLNMITYWHRDKSVDTILPDTDAEIARLNREINVQWAVLLDTLSHQGWSQLVMNLVNKGAPPVEMPIGTRFALPLGVDESASMLSSAVNYTDIVTSLGNFVRLMALALRQSPNDFAIEGSSVASGFAKLVDSLPKIEARNDRMAVLRKQERELAWPRLAVIGNHLGYFDAPIEKLATLTLQTKFADYDIPLSTDEQVRREEHDIRHGMTSPARLLASRNNISIEDAQKLIDENIGANVAEDDDGDGETAGTTQTIDDVQKTALNGAQVTSMVDTVRAAANGEIPRDSAVAILRVGFRLDTTEAEEIMGSVGTPDFSPPAAQPQQPVNAAPPEPTEPPEKPKKSGLSELIGRARGGSKNGS